MWLWYNCCYLGKLYWFLFAITCFSVNLRESSYCFRKALAPPSGRGLDCILYLYSSTHTTHMYVFNHLNLGLSTDTYTQTERERERWGCAVDALHNACREEHNLIDCFSERVYCNCYLKTHYPKKDSEFSVASHRFISQLLENDGVGGSHQVGWVLLLNVLTLCQEESNKPAIGIQSRTGHNTLK